MCGISGFVGKSFTPATGIKFENVFSNLAHRGPNGSAKWNSELTETPFFALGHHRLAINDLDERANQPLFGRGGSRIIVNGEIYNSPQIRQKLSSYDFKTSSDSESLLAVLDTYGLQGMSMVDGMFAFAYIPESQDALWLGRDRLGIKPLYWCKETEGVWFSSEAKPLALALGKQLDEHGFAEWSIFQFQVSDRTFYKDIRSIKPGTVLTISNGNIKTRTYWNLDDHLPSQRTSEVDVDTSVELLREKFGKSVASHMLSDVPIATLTSGGMDSSWVSSISSKSGVTQAFIGRYPESGFDETLYATAVAEMSGLNLSVVNIEPQEFFSGLKQFGKHMDYPGAGPGAIGQFIVAQKIARDFRVVLSGTGGDELFLGYTRDRFPLIAMGLIEATSGTESKWAEIAGDVSGLSGYQQMYKKFSDFNGFTSPIDGFIGIAQRSDLDTGLFQIRPEIQSAVKAELVSYISPNGVDSMSELHNALLRYEVGKFLPSLLQVEDRVTMSCGLESRVPLLATETLEFMLALPLGVRMSGSRPKDLMRCAALGDLPKVVLDRKDKMGFPVPLESWARTEAKSEVNDLISQLRDRHLPYIRNELLDTLLLKPDLGNRNLWAVLTLSTWLNSLER
ncbi:MAG: asparagine synthase (glutamine-hydrolyzing) [Thermoleophilia bacterium]|jgi:asparagine synthase (glutamine-hydrolysing)